MTCSGSADFSGESILKSTLLTGFLSLVLLTGCSSVPSNAVATVGETSDASFSKDVLQSKDPVLVDFYTTWCGPCKIMAPVVEQLSAQYNGKVKVYRMDIEKNPGVAQALGIESIPTFALFKGGRPVDGAVGVVPKQRLAEKIDEHLQ